MNRPHHSGRIFATSKPSQIGAPVLPMTNHDRLWSHTRAMARAAGGER